MPVEGRDRERCLAVRKELLAWFERHKRDLPWRKNYTPYEVWISEIMLQQTQMQRGVEYFLRWMKRFPDIRHVAMSSDEDLLRAWEGLGYYSRAKNIKKAAAQILKEHGGVFPEHLDDIRALPGVGPYTANAIAGIAFRQHVACVDANVERIVSRLFNIDDDIGTREGKARIAEYALALVPEGEARNANQAMMEFGALQCGKNPRCEGCPLIAFCRARKAGVEKTLPVKRKPLRTRHARVALALLRHKGSFLLVKRGTPGLWSGLYTFPFVQVGEKNPETALRFFLTRELSIHVENPTWRITLVHSHTSWHVKLFAYAFMDVGVPVRSLPEGYVWISERDLGALPLPSPHRRILCDFFGRT
ncbi:MAG: A/G-specific adenine glycosylase [Desulfovibrio sp.]|nr:A/G-specific adenine glycosylase [Desulfovibrio sp.]